MQTSKVAPPQTSIEKKPTLSIFSAIGSMDSVRILVAINDWWASRNVVSVILMGFKAINRCLFEDFEDG
jgi:hypothetical protein